MSSVPEAFTYTGDQRRHISFPIGGIGSGCIGLSGTGHLVDWEIMNRPNKGGKPNGYSHFAIKAETPAGELLDARVLHGDKEHSFNGEPATFGFGMSAETLSGLPHFRETVFHGGFPLARIDFAKAPFPGRVSLSAFNPFIPLNDRDSSLPAAFFTIDLSNSTDQTLDYTVAFAVANPAPGTPRQEVDQRAGVSLLRLLNGEPADSLERADFAAATDADDAVVQAYWFRGSPSDSLGVYWQDFARPGPLPERQYAAPKTAPWWQPEHGCLTARLRLAPGVRRAVRFLFAWHVPNCHAYWQSDCGCEAGACSRPRTWRNYYATQFPDAAAIAVYCLREWDRLEEETRRFRDTLFRSTLPPVVLDAISANLSTLKTPTCLRLEDGSFYGWEGCRAEAGCCEGSCTHVWNYAYALPFLFPALERSMRELDYRYNLQPDGSMPFRLQLPLGGTAAMQRPCADGQLGGVLKVYREWKISGDSDWLQSLWPAVRSSLEFAWSPDNAERWDPEQTGVLHGRQHHTLDRELFGPNAWLTGFYIAALKAGAEMAEVCAQPEVAAHYRTIARRGQQWVREQLFNGEYFIQQIDLADRSILAPFGEQVGRSYWSEEHGQVLKQIGEGCGIDQVLAQWHADLIGLGDIFDRQQVRSALDAIYRHNYRDSMRDVFNPSRLFAVDDEGGTVMFTWPEGRERPVIPIPYAEETMHGFEYQAASHLIMHGLIEQGITMVKAVRDRYDGTRRNPWNELECGSNYARSMASYALLLAFSGFRFDMTRQELGFRPIMPAEGPFRCFWSLDGAWGECELSAGEVVLRVLFGELPLTRFDLPLSDSDVTATLDEVVVSCRRADAVLVFAPSLTIHAGQVLRLSAAFLFEAQPEVSPC